MEINLNRTKSTKKVILHIIDSMGVGGAEKLLTGIINDLDDTFEQHLIILHGPETLLPEIKVPCKVTDLGCRSAKDIFFRRNQVRKYIKENKIELVHSHLFESNLLARFAVPKTVKLINSIHAISSLASYKINRISLYLDRWSYRKRHVLVAVSNAVLEDFDKWIEVKGRKYVLYNYIDEKFFQSYSVGKTGVEKELNLVAVGNLRWQKNYPYLLEAFKQLPRNIHLDIYGEGSLRENLQAEIDKYQLNIRLCGLHQDMEVILPRYYAFVMSSFYEGQPVSLLEAMACGLPAILADIPVLKEVTGDDAVYFDISNPESFRTAIEEILKGSFDLQKMADAGRKKIDAFAHKKQYIEQLKNIYEDSIT